MGEHFKNYVFFALCYMPIFTQMGPVELVKMITFNSWPMASVWRKPIDSRVLLNKITDVYDSCAFSSEPIGLIVHSNDSE